jgi:DNA-binding transcriptional ArsR family regulator
VIFDNITLVRARRTDPSTSKTAAKNAERFAASHAGRILEELRKGPRTAAGLSAMTGVTLVQIDRRLPEMEEAGLVETLDDGQGGAVSIGGYRIWKAK